MRDNPYFLHNLDRLFNAAFLDDLTRIAGDDANRNELRKGMIAATRAYLLKRRHMERHKPGKQEFVRAQKLKKKLGDLSKEVHRTYAAPNNRGKFMDALDAQRAAKTNKAPDLLDLLDASFGSGDPMAHLVALVDRLHEAACAVSPQDIEGVAVWQVDEMRAGHHAEELRAWERRAKKRETAPLMALAIAFQPYWLNASERPFTAGKYNKASKQNESYSLDAVLMIAQKLDPKVTRANIVTVMREIPTKF